MTIRSGGRVFAAAGLLGASVLLACTEAPVVPQDDISVPTAHVDLPIDSFAPANQVRLLQGASRTRPLGKIAGVVTDGRGHIFVLDQMAHEVVQFSPDGNLVRVFGGKGTGPGQLSNPRGLISRNDTVFILDDFLEQYDTAGDFLGRVNADSLNFLTMHEVHPFGDGIAYFLRRFARTTGEPIIVDSVYVRYLDLKSGRSANLHVSTSNMRDYGQGVVAPDPLRFRRSFAISANGWLYVAPNDHFLVEMFDQNGTLRRAVSAQTVPTRTTRADYRDYWDEIEHALAGRPDLPTLKRSFDSAPRLALRPVIRSMIADAQGRLLVARADITQRPYAMGQHAHSVAWALLDERGFIAHYLLPSLFTPLHFASCHVYGVLLDEDDVPQVAQYSLTGCARTAHH